MRISIVTPTFNGERFLRQTIESVLNQTFTDWEYLIVDDGSDDACVAIAREFAAKDSRIRVFEKLNGGVARAREFGYEHAHSASEYLIFLDQDDIWHPTFLQKLVDAASSDQKSVGAHCLCLNIDSDGKQIGQGKPSIHSADRRKIVGRQIVSSLPSEPTTFSAMVCDCSFPTVGAFLIRRSALEKVRENDHGEDDSHIFDPTMGQSDDWDLWLRLCLIGDITFVDEILLDYRRHKGNVSNAKADALRSMFLVRNKLAANPSLTHEQRQMAQWRSLRIYASVERRNARRCFEWMIQKVLAGRFKASAQLFGAWMQHTIHYYCLRSTPLTKFEASPLPVEISVLFKSL
jgi:glycosyltransferase involved in cell wall biosynthesis